MNKKLKPIKTVRQKIPQKDKLIGAIAICHYAIFCKGLLKASNIVNELYKAEKKKDGIPMYGYCIYKGEKIFYCRYGLINDDFIYQKKAV